MENKLYTKALNRGCSSRSRSHCLTDMWSLQHTNPAVINGDHLTNSYFNCQSQSVEKRKTWFKRAVSSSEQRAGLLATFISAIHYKISHSVFRSPALISWHVYWCKAHFLIWIPFCFLSFQQQMNVTNKSCASPVAPVVTKKTWQPESVHTSEEYSHSYNGLTLIICFRAL